MMINTISKESKSFLENLRLYLLSSGKKEQEINEIVDELEVHLTEAEACGKSVQQIIEHSPEAYMKQIANELPTQRKQWLPYLMMIVIGGLSYNIIMNALTGNLTYSLLKVLGTVLIAFVFVALVGKTFKFVATKNLTTAKDISLYAIVGMVPLLLFIGLIYLDKAFDTPVIQLGMTGTWIVALLSLLFLIGLSIWAKTWVVLVVLFFLILPEIIFKQISVTINTELLVSSLITFVGIGSYLYFMLKNLK